MKEKIFLSAVTEQLSECRDTLRSDLAAVGADVMVQDDFQQHGGTLLQKLEAYIASCDRVIALVGSAYGREPEVAAIPDNQPLRSYTQWEYCFAMGGRLDGSQAAAKSIFVYFAAPKYLQEHPVKQSFADAKRQKQFISDIRASGKDRNQFDSINELSRLVLRDGFELQSASNLSPSSRPLLVHGVYTAERSTGLDEITFTEVILTVENEGDSVAIGHRPEIRIRSDGELIYNSRQRLLDTDVRGQVPPSHHVGFPLYKLLKSQQSGQQSRSRSRRTRRRPA